MQYPGYNSGKTNLAEGQSFPFKICKHLQLQDGEWYYILQDVNGFKHFLPSEFYRDYSLSIGDEIICRIDKINCTGRIFLEPKHPFYQEGENYLFSIAKPSDCDNTQVIYVHDMYRNCIQVPIYEKLKPELFETNEIWCHVKTIRKGTPILELHRTNC